MRWIAFLLLALAAGAGAASAQPLPECTQPGQLGCEPALLVTGGQCRAIAGDPAADWRRDEIDRFTNACYTCDDLDMDFRFGGRLGFFRCEPRQPATAAGALPVGPAPEPAWQQRECTRYGLQRETDTSLALTVQNRCADPITVVACATWHDGRDSGQGSGETEPGGEIVLRWPVDVYTRAKVVWNFCRPGEVCPAPCP